MSTADRPGPGKPSVINGKHTVVIDGDLLLVRLVGTYEPEEAQQLLDLVRHTEGSYQQLFLLVDLSQATKPPGPATRLVLAKWKPQADVFTAYVGASWVLRTVGILIHRAMRMLNNKQVLAHFADTEPQARAWLNAQRPASAATT